MLLVRQWINFLALHRRLAIGDSSFCLHERIHLASVANIDLTVPIQASEQSVATLLMKLKSLQVSHDLFSRLLSCRIVSSRLVSAWSSKKADRPDAS